MDTILEILIDNSNSMGRFEDQNQGAKYLLADGSTRMELAKKILIDEIIPTLDYAKLVTVRIFHSVTDDLKKSVPIIKTIYAGPLDKAIITGEIQKMAIPTKTGGTPITAAIKKSIVELASRPDTDRKIILVTDGEETDGGDYEKTAEEAIGQYGIPCNIFIVGISQDTSAAEKALGLAKATGGTFINVKAQTYDKSALQTVLRPLTFRALNTSLQHITEQTAIALPVTVTSEILIEPKSIPLPLEAGTHHGDQKAVPPEALNLISKQLLTITEAIEGLQKARQKEEENVSVTENPELNEEVRAASESFLNTKLKEKYGTRLKWLNEHAESGVSYDFEVVDNFDNTTEYYIECKASIHADKVFYMTRLEWLFFLTHRDKYKLFFISMALTTPQLTKIDNLMDWILDGRIVPLSTKNIGLKADRIIFTIIQSSVQ